MSEFPIEISFRNMDHSDAVEANVRENIDGLERFYARIHNCRVMVGALHRRKHKGRLYEVHISLGVPGSVIQVNRTGHRDHAHEDVYVAVRDSFNAATRMLEEHVRVARGKVKAHETPLHGKVALVFTQEKDSYGFITTSDGLEVYFHENSVVDGSFNDLHTGSEVRLVIAEGEGAEGPQASTVKPIGKHHVVQ